MTEKRVPPEINTDLSNDSFNEGDQTYFEERPLLPRAERRKIEFERFNRLFSNKIELRQTQSSSVLPRITNHNTEVEGEIESLHHMLKKSRSKIAFGRRVTNYSRLSAFGEVPISSPDTSDYIEIDKSTLYKPQQTFVYKRTLNQGPGIQEVTKLGSETTKPFSKDKITMKKLRRSNSDFFGDGERNRLRKQSSDMTSRSLYRRRSTSNFENTAKADFSGDIDQSRHRFVGNRAYASFFNETKQMAQAHRVVQRPYTTKERKRIDRDKDVLYKPSVKNRLEEILKRSSSDYNDDKLKRFVVIDGGRKGLEAECSGVLTDLIRNESDPRRLYIRQLVDDNVVPEANIVHRSKKRPLHTFNFSHYGFGPNRAKAICKAFSKLEFVKHIILKNNRLLDTGLLALIENLKDRLESVETLDLGENKFGSRSVEALSNVFSLHSSPVLVVLRLSNANLKDAWGSRLISSLHHVKQTITELDMSSNFLGDKSALALSKTIHKTRIKILNLANNDIGRSGSGATLFCKSISKCTRLLQLNMRSNMLGKSCSITNLTNCLLKISENEKNDILDIDINQYGNNKVRPIDFLAFSLLFNAGLKKLDISSNFIGPRACFCISRALIENKSLNTLLLNDNPITESGSRSLIRVTEHGINLQKLELKSCDYIGIVADQGDLFDPLQTHYCYPSSLEKMDHRVHAINESTKQLLGVSTIDRPALNMQIPYDYFIMTALLEMAEDYPGFRFDHLYHSADGNGKGNEIVLTKRPVNADRHVLKEYKHIFRSISAKRQGLKPADHNINDAWLSFEETKQVIRDMHMKKREQVCDRYLNAFLDQADQDNDGEITWQEFQEGLRAARSMFGAGAQRYFLPVPGIMATSNRLAWKIPTSGTISLEATLVPSIIPKWRCCTEYSFRRLIALARSVDNDAWACRLIYLSTRDVYYRTEQAAGLIDLLIEFYGSGKDSSEWIAEVLLAVVDKENNTELVQHLLSSQQRFEIREYLGNLYPLAIGFYTGHYSLNLADKYRDRRIALMLIQRQFYEIQYARSFTNKNEGDIDTSQCGNGMTCIRNATWAGAVYVAAGESNKDIETVSKEIDVNVEEYFDAPSRKARPLEKYGMLRFDFVESLGPDPSLKVMNSSQFHVFVQKHLKTICNRLLGWSHATRRPLTNEIFKKVKNANNSLTRQKMQIIDEPSETSAVGIDSKKDASTVSKSNREDDLKDFHTPQNIYVRFAADNEIKAASRISSLFRGYTGRVLARKKLFESNCGKLTKEIRNRNSCAIQRLARGFIGRRAVANLVEPPRPPFKSNSGCKDVLWYLAPLMTRNPKLEENSMDEAQDEDPEVIVDGPSGDVIWEKQGYKNHTSYLVDIYGAKQYVKYWQWCTENDTHGSVNTEVLNFDDVINKIVLDSRDQKLIARNALLELTEKITHAAFTADQCSKMIDIMPRGLNRIRENLAVVLFPRCVDPGVFETKVFPLLIQEERQSVTRRIGILNLWNPKYTERTYIMHLNVFEERQVAVATHLLNDAEGGNKIINAHLVNDLQDIDGIECSVQKKIGQKGIYGFTYSRMTQQGQNMQILKSNVEKRKEWNVFRESLCTKFTYLGRLKRRKYYHHGMIRSTIRVQACARGMLTRKVLRKGKKLLAQVDFANKSERQSAYKIQARIRGFLIRFFLKKKKFTVKDLREKLERMNSSTTNLTSKSILSDSEQKKRKSRGVYRLYSGLMEAHFGKRNVRRSVDYGDF